MGKCASKQQLTAHSSYNQRNRHHDLLNHQLFNAYEKKSNRRLVDNDAIESSISDHNIFLLIENEVIFKLLTIFSQ